MVPPASDSLSRVESYSGIPLGLRFFHIRDFHPLWSAIPGGSVKSSGPTWSYNPTELPRWFGLIRVRSPLLTESRFLSFPPGTEMFQFPGLARESRDQYSFDSFPELFAVFHALAPSGAKTSPTRPY